MASRIGWQFIDPTTLEHIILEINPNDEGGRPRRKTTTIEDTSAPDGAAIIFEGRDEVPTATWSGVVLYEHQYDTMLDWFEKRHQFMVIDDLGREDWIYVRSIDMRRRPSQQFPWKHEYSMDVIFLNWGS